MEQWYFFFFALLIVIVQPYNKKSAAYNTTDAVLILLLAALYALIVCSDVSLVKYTEIFSVFAQLTAIFKYVADEYFKIYHNIFDFCVIDCNTAVILDSCSYYIYNYISLQKHWVVF